MLPGGVVHWQLPPQQQPQQQPFWQLPQPWWACHASSAAADLLLLLLLLLPPRHVSLQQLLPAAANLQDWLGFASACCQLLLALPPCYCLACYSWVLWFAALALLSELPQQLCFCYWLACRASSQLPLY
jgi:hypothetical protein